MKDSEEGMRYMRHFQFCGNISRKIGFLKLAEEKYGLLREGEKKKGHVRNTGCESCHPYIKNNIILNSMILSLEKATV